LNSASYDEFSLPVLPWHNYYRTGIEPNFPDLCTPMRENNFDKYI
jgi:hypothetical protein